MSSRARSSIPRHHCRPRVGAVTEPDGHDSGLLRVVPVMTQTPEAPSKLTMYSTTWCGYCRRLKSQLERDGIEYTEIDIEVTPGAAEFVMSVNGGNQTVPTGRHSRTPLSRRSRPR